MNKLQVKSCRVSGWRSFAFLTKTSENVIREEVYIQNRMKCVTFVKFTQFARKKEHLMKILMNPMCHKTSTWKDL